MRPKARAFYAQVLPAILYSAAIFYLGLIPAPQVDTGFVPADKVAHLLAFGGMQWLFLRALRFFRPQSALRKQIAVTVSLATMAGLFLELAQALVPYRSAEGWDFVADALGALFGGAASWLLFRRAERAQSVSPRTESARPL